ncbi:MAG TPA: MFS transporter [Bacillota bacterium]|nr:MFS transporter [Bacillota bacterium]
MNKILLLSLGMFALGFDAYIVAGLIPGISETYNKDISQVGQAVSIFTLFYAVSAPVFSSILAGKNIKKVLLYSMLIFTIANGFTAIAPTFLLLLISRAVAGIGAGLFSPLAVAASTQFVPPEKRGRALGLTVGGMSIGTVLGVPVGLYISELYDWKITMWTLVVIGIIAIVGMIILLPNIPTVPPPALKERLKLFLDKRVTVTVLITFFAGIASLGLYTYLSVLIDDLTIDGHLKVFLWVWGLGGLCGSLMIGYLIDLFNKPKTLVTVILVVLTISILCIPFVIHIPFLKYVPFFVWGAVGWASLAPQQHILLSYQPKNGSIAIALNSSINYLGSSIGAMLGGVVIAIGLGSTSLIYFAAIAMVIAIVFQLYSVKKL